MVNVKAPICRGCKKCPSFNLQGETKPLYCKTHKTSEMVNVVYKLCREPGCLNQSSFNLPGKAKNRYCATHKTPEMVNVTSTRVQHAQAKVVDMLEKLTCADAKEGKPN